MHCPATLQLSSEAERTLQYNTAHADSQSPTAITLVACTQMMCTAHSAQQGLIPTLDTRASTSTTNNTPYYATTLHYYATATALDST